MKKVNILTELMIYDLVNILKMRAYRLSTNKHWRFVSSSILDFEHSTKDGFWTDAM